MLQNAAHRSCLEFLTLVARHFGSFPAIDDNEVAGSLLECASKLASFRFSSLAVMALQ